MNQKLLGIGIVLIVLIGGSYWFGVPFNLKSQYSNEKLIISRDSNHTAGISVIQEIETRDLLNEAKKINSSDNSYINITSNYWTITNETITKYNQTLYESQIENEKGKYTAYGWSVSSNKITDQQITNLVHPISIDRLFNLGGEISKDLIFNKSSWTVSGELSSLNVEGGWIIYQRIEYGFIKGSLNGGGELIDQILILDSQKNLLWITNRHSMWKA